MHKPELTCAPLAIAQTLRIKIATAEMGAGGLQRLSRSQLVDGQQSAGGLPQGGRFPFTRNETALSVARELFLSVLAMVGGSFHQRLDRWHAPTVQSARNRASERKHVFVRYRTLQNDNSWRRSALSCIVLLSAFPTATERCVCSRAREKHASTSTEQRSESNSRSSFSA